VKKSVESYGDAAIVVLSRIGGEGADSYFDHTLGEGKNYLALNEAEKSMMAGIKQMKDEGKIKKIVVLINTSNALQVDFLKNNEYGVDATLWIGGVGQTGLNAVAEILNGTINPSGSLPDTYCYNNYSSPVMQNFTPIVYEGDTSKIPGHADTYMVYQEGIYVGYKYYETRYEDFVMGKGNAGDYKYGNDVAFPFGYGLSYSTFEYSNMSYTFDKEASTYTIKVTVKNTGSVAGKETVQIYVSSPYTQYDITNKVEKASVQLVGFGKTKTLEPGKSEELTIVVDGDNVASYDAYGAGTYIMDEGDYYFTAATDAHNAANNVLAAKGFTAEQWENGSIPQETLDAARQYSIKEAQEATFRDSNAFSDAISKVGFKNPQNGVQKAMNVAVQGVIPFRKTPANVAVQAERHSLLGLVNTAVNAVRASNSSDVDANDVIKSLSETLTGSGLVLLGGALAAAGFATGSKDEDEKLAQIDDLTGGQEYAFVIPGVGSYTYDSLTPASMSFALGVETYKAFERNGFTPSAFFEAVSGATDIMLNMSMLSGLNDAFENVSYSDTPLVDAALNSVVSYFTQGLASTLGGQIERIFEDKRMTTFRDKNGDLSTNAQYALGKTSAKTPGWDFQQIPYIDAWGRTEDSGNTVFRAFSNLLSPGYASKENVTKADEEIRRLAESGYTGAVPFNVEFSKKVDGEYMNSEQYVEYATTKGQTSYDIVDDMIASDFYKGLTDEEKANALSLAYSYAGHLAAEEITNGKHESERYVELAQKAHKDLGLSEAEYLMYYEMYGGTVMNGDMIREAYGKGISPVDFANYSAGVKKYDSNNNGSYTIPERAKSIEGSGLSNSEQETMWELYYPDWKKKADENNIKWSVFIEYKIVTNGINKKQGKIDALINAGYTKKEAENLYAKIK
jgi:hypothetical protein